MFGDATRIEKKKTSDQNANHFTRRENYARFPTQFKKSMNQSTGLPFDNIQMRYNSDLPTKIGTPTYMKKDKTDSNPDQERHLPHTLNHIVQRKLRIARANAMHSDGVTQNIDTRKGHQTNEGSTQKRVAVIQRIADNIIQRCKSSTKSYQTYTKKAPNGTVYSGRTSGYGTPQENVSCRDANHHMNGMGYGPAVLDRSSTNLAAIRGREQDLIDRYGGAQSTGGMSGNRINGIAANNPNRETYLRESRREFGDVEQN